MKAIYFADYGKPEKVLSLREMQRPEPSKNQVLVRVKASAINDYDWSVVTGKPLAYRLLFGVFKPRKKFQIPGMELSGVIESLGPGASRFNPGDEVYGDTSEHGFGTLAEYICIDEKALRPKPDFMSFVAAAALPHASMLALQGLQQLGEIREGQHLLINGGGGGVGTLALQMAKLKKAVVTGVDTGEKLKMMKELGYDQVIDYRAVDFTRNQQQYDFILDCKTNRSPSAYLRALKPNGSYITIGGKSGKLILMMLCKAFLPVLTGKKLGVLAVKTNRDLDKVAEMYRAKQLQCIIDGPYLLEDTAIALNRFGEGKHSGKVIVSMDKSPNKPQR